MPTCYKCGEDTFLKVHKEIIDGEEKTVCGKCKDVVCCLCGKTKHKDGITRWSYQTNPETGEIVSIGSCCTFVAGKMDIFKLYSEKYNNLKKNSPEVIQEMDRAAKQKQMMRQQHLGRSDVADRLIDNWARSKKKA